jgi:hypothetical protein
LLVFGANPCQQNNHGLTPRELASSVRMTGLLSQTRLELSRSLEEIQAIRQEQRGQLGQRQVIKSVASSCDVCMLESPSGQLVSCASCGIWVHLSCYETPAYLANCPLRATFLCDPCLYSCGSDDLLPTKVRCVLCPAIGGKSSTCLRYILGYWMILICFSGARSADSLMAQQVP